MSGHLSTTPLQFGPSRGVHVTYDVAYVSEIRGLDGLCAETRIQVEREIVSSPFKGCQPIPNHIEAHSRITYPTAVIRSRISPLLRPRI